MTDKPTSVLMTIIMICSSTLALFGLLVFCLSSCTLSMQNISTHGTATDLVDEEQAASPQVDAKVSAPLPMIAG